MYERIKNKNQSDLLREDHYQSTYHNILQVL